MKRSGPLRRTASLRRTAMRVTAKRGKPDIPADVRAQVYERDRGACTFPRNVDGPCGGPVHLHHVLRRSQGGQHVAANLKSLCRSHHEWVHANVWAAEALGLLQRSGSDA